jgi:hypothetical protein
MIIVKRSQINSFATAPLRASSVPLLSSKTRNKGTTGTKLCTIPHNPRQSYAHQNHPESVTEQMAEQSEK